MSRKPNTVEGGSKTNVNGLSFEGRTNLLESFEQNPNFNVVDNKVIYNNQLVGEYFEKHNFYKSFLIKNEIYWKTINSKKYLPDSVFYNHKNKTFYIIEKKISSR